MNPHRYKAFISYSHSLDGELAPWLQQALYKFAKPWYRIRSLRLFRDKTSLALTPELWPTIEQALADSENFILLASPEAATSRWVNQEVKYWVTNRSHGSFFIVLTDGNLRWDIRRNEFDWSQTDALPSSLKGYFKIEPLYLDLRWARTADDLSLRQPRLQDAIADLAAPLHGRPKDELVGADIREHRHTLQLAWAAALTLFFFTILTGFAAIYANLQRQEAERSARNSLGRALAAQSTTYSVTKPETSLLLAVEAIEATHIDEALVLPAAEEALRNALATLGGSTPLSDHSGNVTDAAFSPDGEWVATTGEDGKVNVWHSDPDQPKKYVLQFNTGAVQSTTFSPDGRRLLVVGNEVAKVWDVGGLDDSPLFETSSDSNIALASFIGGGDLLALCLDGELQIVKLDGKWSESVRTYSFEGSPIAIASTLNGDNVTIGTDQNQLLEISPHVGGSKLETFLTTGLGTITTFRGSDDGRWLFAGDLEGRAIVIDRHADPPKERVLSVRPEDMKGFQRPSGTDPFGDVQASIDKVAFDLDGSYVAAGMRNGTIRIWDLLNPNKKTMEIQAHNDTILQIAFGPKGQWLMSSGRDEQTRFFSMPDGKEFFSAPHLHEAPVDVVEINPARTQLLTADRSGKVRLWWLAPERSEPMQIPGFNDAPAARVVAFDKQKERLAWTTEEPYPFVLTRLLSGGDPTLLARFEREVTVTISDDGRYLAASGVDPRVFLWDLEHPGTEPSLLVGHAPAVFSLAFSSNGKWVASGGGDDTVRIWRVNDPTKTAQSLLPHGSAVGTLTFDSSGSLLATGDWSGTVRVWSVPGGTILREEKVADYGTIRKVLITPNDRWLVSCAGNTVWIHDLTDNIETRTLRGHTDMVTLLAVDESSQWLATGSWDGSVRLWRFASSELAPLVLRGHVKGLRDMVISPDGTRLATTEGNAEVLLWDITTHIAPPVRLHAPDKVSSLAFGPEGRRVLAVTENGGVTVWDLNVNNLVKLGCKLAGRALSLEEWHQFCPGQPYRPQCLPE